jgi:GNAT superfamily N-acetyltransferase
VLGTLERYYDGVPRSAARVEQIGGLTLFVKIGPGFAYYARPALGTLHVGPEDVQRTRARQRELGIPQAFEWVAETTPSMQAAASGAGLTVMEYPLMVLREHRPPVRQLPPDLEVRLVTLDDDFALLGAVAPLAFGAPGTAVGPAGLDAVRALAANADRTRVEFDRGRLRRGDTIRAVALAGGVPVATGVHLPVGAVTEIAGVAVVPAFRRCGIGSALTSLLVAEALRQGIETVFLSAGDEATARVYSRLGFDRVGTACAAEPPGGDPE